MKILALESSAKCCSVALLEDKSLIAQVFLHNGNTHSCTLLPAVEQVLNQCNTPLANIDVIATAIGPGSFTGLRIAIATVKGLAFATDIPCAPCSTLASMAWQLAHLEGSTVIPVMDARKKQVYQGKFLIKDGIPTRISPDAPISLDELAQDLETILTDKIFLGDGAELSHAHLPHIPLAPSPLLLQTAYGVGQEAFSLAQQNLLISHEDLLPNYLRLSQAEQERLKKHQNQ